MARSDRRHLVADRDRGDDQPAAGRHRLQAGFGDAGVAGINADVVDDHGGEGPGGGGYLVLETSRGRRCCAASGATRSATRTPTGPRWPQYYFAGDGAKLDEDGAIWLLGRVDDVMNVSGHRISTTEVESALVSHELVAEAAVVGASDETTGQASWPS